MHLEGETQIAAGRQAVWDALTDPRTVATCVPGQPAIEYLDERNFRVTAEVGNGFMKTTVTVEVELTELAGPERAEANATAAVMVSPAAATGSLALEEIGPSLTRAAWSADVTLGGMLVGFGGMVQGPLQKGIESTLECLKARIEAGAGDSGASGPDAG